MLKLIAVLLFVLIGLSAEANGDSIVLRDFNKEIEAKVMAVTNGYVDVEVPKGVVKSLQMRFSEDDDFSDRIFFDDEKVFVPCKIRKIAENSVFAMIPPVAIASLRMTFSDNHKRLHHVDSDFRDEKEDENVGKEGMDKDILVQKQENNFTEKRETPLVNELRTDFEKKTDVLKYRSRTKQKIKDNENKSEVGLEWLETSDNPAELNKNEYEEKQTRNTAKPVIKNNPKDSLLSLETENEEKTVKENSVLQNPDLGGVEGRILKGGEPFKGCIVQLRMMEEKQGLLHFSKGYRLVEGAAIPETVTDEKGEYHFRNIHPGLYKLYWKPPDENTWTRRFKMEPDVKVKAGETVRAEEIEILKRTLN